MRFILPLFFAFLWASELLAVNLGSMRKSLFKIHVVSQTPNYEQPWAQNAVSSSSGTGFYIGKEGILTNAHVVADGKFITVLRDGDDKPMTARVRFIAHDCDLALLEVSDPNYFKGVPALQFADFPEMRGEVNTIGYPTGGEQLSITQGVVSRVSYRRYVHTGADSHLLVQVDAAINPGNSGGPVVQKDKVVGVAFQSQAAAENTGYIIPTPIVKRFLADIKDKHYDGHPVQGLWFMDGALENAATREYHKLKKGDGGVKLSRIAEYSPARGNLFPGDIILALDGKPIGVDGKVVMFNERINLRALYDLKQRGDKVKFDVLRDGVHKKVEFPLVAKASFYEPGLKYTVRPRYFTVAGLVFSGLTRNYLQEWGRSWNYDAPLILRYVQNFGTEVPQFKGKRDIVVLTERLAHPVNTYAGPFMEEILLKLNGQAINSVEDIPRIIAEGKDEYLIFEFMDQATPMVLERKAVLEADATILQQYQVPLASWFGSDSDDSATANWEGEGEGT